MQIKKREALAVLRKLRFDLRTGKERFARFYYQEILILTTSVPKGKGDMHVANQFRKQLKLSENQLKDAIRCPFGHTEYISHLNQIGIIDS